VFYAVSLSQNSHLGKNLVGGLGFLTFLFLMCKCAPSLHSVALSDGNYYELVCGCLYLCS